VQIVLAKSTIITAIEDANVEFPVKMCWISFLLLSKKRVTVATLLKTFSKIVSAQKNQSNFAFLINVLAIRANAKTNWRNLQKMSLSFDQNNFLSMTIGSSCVVPGLKVSFLPQQIQLFFFCKELKYCARGSITRTSFIFSNHQTSEPILHNNKVYLPENDIFYNHSMFFVDQVDEKTGVTELPTLLLRYTNKYSNLQL